jgi:hypothetical protein
MCLTISPTPINFSNSEDEEEEDDDDDDDEEEEGGGGGGEVRTWQTSEL